ncbi:pyridoxal-phosphate dependent enzyme [Henriciella aquimarina]|uniref:pyridoxal-phosphate dependent enzyme n=1 Tax=Henriciella aquimarina TaxID=545261 RepID=UPI000A062930|nr:pyridoxal-phosphate dependent enzyme [Henriciella aquimarina]
MTGPDSLKMSDRVETKAAAIAECPFRIGNTPFRRLRIPLNGQVHEICLKEERQNAFGSIKDRVAWYLLFQARKDDCNLRHVADASSGNYGYALACIGRELGLGVTIVSSPSITAFNAEGIRKTGARLIIADSAPGESSNAARMRVAGETAERTGARFLNQYASPLNPEAHRVWTAPEVFSEGPFHACFMTSSSGGTGRGFSDYLAETPVDTRLFFVEPSGSQAFLDANSNASSPSLPGYGSGRRSSFAGLAHPPDMIRVDEAAVVAAFSLFRDLEIAPVGLSSVGVVLGALEWLSTQTEARRVACICADGAERYLEEFDSRYRPGVSQAVFEACHRTLSPLLGALVPDV